MVVGGSLAFGMHELNPVFESVRDVERIAGVKFLGPVSDTGIDERAVVRRGQLLRFAAACVALVLVFGAVLFLQIYLPLTA